MTEKFNKIYKFILTVGCIAVASAMASSCGHKGNDGDNGKETQQQIDSAINAGREAARAIILRREWRDSMEFHRAILDATAAKSRYTLEGKKQCEAAYDSAFISTIRTTRPDLARQLE